MKPALSPRGEGLAAIHVATALLGATALFATLDASPVWIIFGRCAFASAALFVIVTLRRRSMRAPLRVWLGAAGTAALLALHWISFFVAIQWAGIGLTMITISTFPLFTLALEAWSERRRMTWAEAGAALGLVGAIALVASPDTIDSARIVWGMGFGVFAAASFAVFALFSQRLVAHLGPARLSCMQYGFAGLWLIPLLPFASPALHGAEQWLAVAALGIVFTSVAHQLYLFALTRVSASVCSSVVCLEPLYAMTYAALVFKAPAPPSIWISVIIASIASWVLLRRTQAAEPLAQ